MKRALRDAVASPLALVVSEEIYSGVVRQGYVNGGPYEQLVRVRVGNRQHRGWVNIPVPDSSAWPPIRRLEDPVSSPSLALAKAGRSGRVTEETVAAH